ncbi:unnamed protein product [Acanthoscelides obtectus]|uniref:Uncharacterized protein n=1 Tax=Acanthoscelides obtectus TaxID=200917 RepID=A0A9P0LBL6_ACAOB|nr:unnamed protein product [Acanthoscelides obtectus]CAK1667856.1 hypothetical protein AOBTE_LOCUS26073 [Acanthoscelides obtectus]
MLACEMMFSSDFELELSKHLDGVMQRYQECKTRSAFEVKNAAKRYYLQKELRALKFSLLDKQSEINGLKKKQKDLYADIILLEKQTKATKELIDEVIRTMELSEEQYDHSEAKFCREMNEFISGSREIILKMKNMTIEKNEQDESDELRKLKREEVLAQLHHEGQMEGLSLFKEYKKKKDENMKLIQDLLCRNEIL